MELEEIQGEPASMVEDPQAVYRQVETIRAEGLSFAYDRDRILTEAAFELPKGAFAVITGPSGVGKSTFVNSLLGDEWLETGGVNEVTGKGRHTTVARELVVLPGGGVLVDNPGMREIQMWTDVASLRAQFDDLTALASECRFADCSHRKDAGCAIRAALESGALSAERYEHFLNLENEIAELERRSAKRQMTLERVTKREKRHKFRNREDREDHAGDLDPNRKRF